MVSINMKSFTGFLKFTSQLFITRKTADDDIHLTFDDGPHATNTTKILGLLSQYEQKASFFLVGQEIENHPDIALAIYQQGHSLGYHSFSHQHAKDSGFMATWNDLKKAKQLEDKYHISFNNRYRPPYGAITLPTLIAILLSGWKIYLWSIDSLDSYTDTKNVLIQLDPKKLSAGEIILMHDDYKTTPETLDRLLALYKSTKISLVSI